MAQRVFIYLAFVCICALCMHCTKTDMPVKPNVSFIISPLVRAAHPGDTLNFQVDITDNTFIADYAFVDAFSDYGNTTVVTNPSLHTKHLVLTQGYKVPVDYAGQVVIVFSIDDQAGRHEVRDTINVTFANGPNFTLYKSVLLGNFKDSSTGGFLSSATAKVYTQLQAATSPNDIDIVFYIGIHTLATIAAPGDDNFGTGANQVDFGIQKWKTRHRTQFKSVYSGYFDPVKNGYDIKTAYYRGSYMNHDYRAEFIDKGMVFGFLTDAGKFGLVKIVDFSPDANSSGTGTMKIDMLVEK
jgi:hypothetical protein